MSRPNALYVPCYPGELGWEVINYVPYINHLVSRGNYAEVHITVREGRESLYPMGTHFYPIPLPLGKSMGNSGPKLPPSKVCNVLQRRFVVKKALPLPHSCRYAKKRKFFTYIPSKESCEKWDDLPSNLVGCLIRGRPFGSHKNWEGDNWVQLIKLLQGLNFTPVIIGLKEESEFEAPEGSVDLRGKTDCSDLISVMFKSKFVIGQSTGTAHLASLIEVPHAVWGSQRIKERYIETWNPHKTLVEYHSCGKLNQGWHITFSEVADLAERMVKKIEKI